MNEVDKLWVVVDVRRGIPVNVLAYRNKKSADRCQKKLQAHINPDDDEIGLFLVNVENEHLQSAYKSRSYLIKIELSSRL